MKLSAIAILGVSLLASSVYAINNTQTTTIATTTPQFVTLADMQKSLAAKNLAKGEAFLAANKKQPGVVTMPDGLQYKVIQEGTGPKPNGDDWVTLHYSLIGVDGKEVDSSYKLGHPITVAVNNMMPGWIEALKMMRTGSKWELFVPAKLAYGEQGALPTIGPNEALVFKIHLISVDKR